MCSGWLDARTTRNIQMFGSDFLPVMHETISHEAIPVLLGWLLEGNQVSGRDEPITPFVAERDGHCAAKMGAALAECTPGWHCLQNCRATAVPVLHRTRMEHSVAAPAGATVNVGAWLRLTILTSRQLST